MLKDKVIIVTGGASGIGRSAADMFARDGARVMIADRSADAGAAASEAICAAGGEAAFVACDVADDDSVAAMVAATVARFGRLDGAFNNAGIEFASKIVPDLSFAEWRRVIDINLNGVFLCMKHEIAQMRQSGGGAIVNTASGAAVAASPNMAEYATSKAGVTGLTRAASCEYRDTQVRVNAVLPGLILTPMTEERLFNDAGFAAALEPLLVRHSVGRFGQPDDVAEAARWLLSDLCPFVNGISLPVDGGLLAR
ncbi:SDR family NAD(P)-dependent oxidoreductase [Sphingomonas bisphenolicum]|uniref:Short chain dehydrogenase n=1 Tax=Sphingomonas bisphenolicum TaxID=296544 RepID=A0ABM7FXU6_9SPHN|nr:glucose 1-dehydrogenase [Sphingomonas bisphenolicum]BBF69972.1 short chain dehydrogenase [Sphingomonas bisphenolicum]